MGNIENFTYTMPISFVGAMKFGMNCLFAKLAQIYSLIFCALQYLSIKICSAKVQISFNMTGFETPEMPESQMDQFML